MTSTLTAAQIRKELGHPIVDADGHFMELGPVVNDEIVSYLEEAGGAALREKFLGGPTRMLDTAVFPADRTTREDPPLVERHAVLVGQSRCRTATTGPPRTCRG